MEYDSDANRGLLLQPLLKTSEFEPKKGYASSYMTFFNGMNLLSGSLSFSLSLFGLLKFKLAM